MLSKRGKPGFWGGNKGGVGVEQRREDEITLLVSDTLDRWAAVATII